MNRKVDLGDCSSQSGEEDPSCPVVIFRGSLGVGVAGVAEEVWAPVPVNRGS